MRFTWVVGLMAAHLKTAPTPTWLEKLILPAITSTASLTITKPGLNPE